MFENGNQRKLCASKIWTYTVVVFGFVVCKSTSIQEVTPKEEGSGSALSLGLRSSIPSYDSSPTVVVGVKVDATHFKAFLLKPLCSNVFTHFGSTCCNWSLHHTEKDTSVPLQLSQKVFRLSGKILP